MRWWMTLLDLVGLNPHRKAVSAAVESAMRKGQHLSFDDCANVIGMSADQLGRSYFRAVAKVLRHLLGTALESGRLDDGEVAALRHLYSLYGTEILSRWEYRMNLANLLWRAETLPLPVMSAPFILKRGERCFFSGSVEAYEIRSQTVRRSYSGGSTSIRLGRGVYLRSGSYRTRSYKQDVRHSFGSGTIAITNDRTIISLPNKNVTIRHNALIAVDYGPHTIAFHKGSGKPLFVTFPYDPVVSVILSRCIDQDFGDHRLGAITPGASLPMITGV